MLKKVQYELNGKTETIKTLQKEVTELENKLELFRNGKLKMRNLQFSVRSNVHEEGLTRIPTVRFRKDCCSFR